MPAEAESLVVVGEVGCRGSGCSLVVEEGRIPGCRPVVEVVHTPVAVEERIVVDSELVGTLHTLTLNSA